MRISISTKGYKSKPTRIPTIEYVVRNMSIEDIASYIGNGHAISANFTDDESKRIIQKQRTLKNFKDICFVFFDLDDDVTMSLDELNEWLKLKPSICYTTYSHLQEGKGNRYRLLYFFDSPICNTALYKRLYENITNINSLKLNDNCGKNCVQNVFGTYCYDPKYSLINNGIIYRINDIMGDESAIINNNNVKEEEKERSIIECDVTFAESEIKSVREHIITNEDFINDYGKLKIRDIIEKYSNMYDNIQETPLEYPDEDTAYILYPNDYICIRRRWVPYHIQKENGDILEDTKIRKIRDGEGRKHLLFVNGIIRRMITNDSISFDNLLFNILYDFYYYYEHKDITHKQIMQIANNAWNEDLSKYETMRGSEHRFRVNPLFCKKRGLRPKQATQIAIKQMNYEKIGELYDNALTDKENVNNFKKNGLDISTRTLKRWREENGITIYQKKTKKVKCTVVKVPISKQQNIPSIAY